MALGGIGAAGAAAAYAAVGRAGAATPGPGSATPGGEAGGFAGMLTRAMEAGIQISRTAEVASTQAMTGQGGVTEAVLAISRAELTLQTAVAVRDRVVSAYQEVMRMPI